MAAPYATTTAGSRSARATLNEHLRRARVRALGEALARHAKLETTMKYYARVELEDPRSEIEKFVPGNGKATRHDGQTSNR